MDPNAILKDRIRGSLVGGAVGDALGYCIEFLSEPQIFQKYGSAGITDYSPDKLTGLAVISDDTQMTLFTANALLYGIHRQRVRGISAEPRHYALQAYLGWLHTQDYFYSEEKIPDDWRRWVSYLLWDVPQLYVRRAPGITCLGALQARKEALEQNISTPDFIADKLNNSKGCGGVMRIAPLGLAVKGWDMARLDMEGAQLAAITHSHPLGYMSAAVLTHILHRLAHAQGEADLKAIVIEAKDFAADLFLSDPYIEELISIIDMAICLAENGEDDLANIHLLGEGWVGEEALAIALYCSLKYADDFSKAITVSVNHKGDSDSTGAITGNIMGALLGYDKIDEKWLTSLELHSLILDMADRLWAASYGA